MNNILLKNVRIFPNKDLKNIFIENSLIKKIFPSKNELNLPASENNINGKYIIPAFTDAHGHYISWALSKTGPYLGNIKSKEESFSIVTDYIKKDKLMSSDKIILACDYDENLWVDNQNLNKRDIDTISNKIPIIFRRICGHYAVCNSKALKFIEKIVIKNNINIDLINFKTGVMVEDPVLKLYELIDFSDNDYENAIKYTEDQCLKMGITSVGEIPTKRGREELIKYHKKNKLKIRFKCSVLDTEIDEFLSNQENIMLNNNFLSTIAIKTFIDGSIGGRTAYVDFKWKDLHFNDHKWDNDKNRNNYGIRLRNNTEIYDLINKAKQNNMMIWMHTIGNKAIDIAVTEIEKFNYPDMIRIEHFELIDLSIIERVKKLKIFLSMQPNFVRLWSGKGKLYEKVLPDKYLFMNNAFALLGGSNSNSTIAFSSDTMPPGPFWGISGAVNAEYQNQRITLEDAIKYYTENSAKAIMQYDVGKIEENKKADILVLSEKPTNSNLDSIKIEKVFVEGKIYD